MADVMSDVNNSIAKLHENKESIKVNGDTSDDLDYKLERDSNNEPDEGDEPKDSYVNHKLVNDVNNVDRVHEQALIAEKLSNPLANGHLRTQASTNDTQADSDDPLSSSKNNEESANSVNADAVHHKNSTNLSAGAEKKTTDEQSSSHAASVSEANDNEEVLNLKTVYNEERDTRIPKEGSVVGDTFKTEGGLSITVVSGKGTPVPRDQHSNDDGTGSLNSSRTDDSENNNSTSNSDNKDDDATSRNNSIDKTKKNSRKTPAVTITPRRSSRNLNKQKNYSDKDCDVEETLTVQNYSQSRQKNDDDDVQEVALIDPLADDPRARMRNSKTIVVSDTKGLVEFASNARSSKSNKKEPTLVIIDTKSILSGRGPIPVSSSGSSQMLHSGSISSAIPVSLPISAGSLTASSSMRGVPVSTSAFSVIPIGLPAQGMYSQYKTPPPQIKPIVVGPPSTTVTPITIQASSANTMSLSATVTASTKQAPVILPSLSDDMFVVEAPSFIVPYVYEKPPVKALKEQVEKIQAEIKAADDKDREEREKEQKEQDELKEREQKEEAELKEKEQEEKDDKQLDEKQTDTQTEEKDDKEKEDIDSDKVVESKEEKTKSATQDYDLEMGVDEEKATASPTINSENNALASCKADEEGADKKDELVKKDESEKKDGTEKKDDSEKKNDSEKKDQLEPAKDDKKPDDVKKPPTYFDNPLGKFFIQIGLNLVQEHVQTDLLRSQKRKRDKEGENCSPEVQATIHELTKTLECSKENNDPFKLDLKKCELCSFKTESILVMAHHLETPHMKNYMYRCNFCPLEVRSPHDILFHMEAEHNVRGRLERAPAFHQCASCPFEDNQKGKLTRHMVSCAKKYRPERNQEPPLDWEPPAKIPRVTRNRPPSMSPGNAVYQAAMSGLKQVPQNSLLPKLMPTGNTLKPNIMNVNKRPNAVGAPFVNRFPNANSQSNFQQRSLSVQGANQGIMYRAGTSNSQAQMVLPQGYQLTNSNTSMYHQNSKQASQQGLAATKLLNQPSISITPLPRQTPSAQQSFMGGNANNTAGNMKAGKPPGPGSKNSFVVCEICDGYIKDLEQLRNHMQWIHKVKIHPKMIYNRPPLNCQKCQFRFFTDQGLERHLLGSHGLVTSSMQEAANKGKDGGRCPVCGRVYQWKLLNHVARDHQMALKPAHLSYKCTVCTATFGMYKQFESHVYSAHSMVAKRAMDSKKPTPSAHPPSSSAAQNEALLKPLKINDEITIIPQPIRSNKPPTKSPGGATVSVTSKK